MIDTKDAARGSCRPGPWARPSRSTTRVERSPIGPNAAGKSNLLDAFQMLARTATERTLADADPRLSAGGLHLPLGRPARVARSALGAVLPGSRSRARTRRPGTKSETAASLGPDRSYDRSP
ncbi:MAG: AAA family ATPase [Thermoleophilaceae bacterium]